MSKTLARIVVVEIFILVIEANVRSLERLGTNLTTNVEFMVLNLKNVQIIFAKNPC